MAFAVEPVQTREQWERAVALRNISTPEGPTTVERAMNYSAAIPQRVPKFKFLVTSGGNDLAYLSILQAYWFDNAELFDFDFHYDKDMSAIEAAIDLAEQTIRENGGKIASCWCRTDRPEGRDALLRRGYEEGQRNPVGMIELSSFEPADWAEQVAKVKGDPQYRIVTIADYAAANPDAWMHDYWRLEMDLLADVPLPEPWKDIPFEDWKKELLANEQKLDWMYFALHDDALAGTTQLLPNFVDSRIMNTGLTGVRRDYRRRGLATALKANAFTLAKAAGAERIYMDNEVNNPMYQLNLALGVRPIFEYVNTRRTLTAG